MPVELRNPIGLSLLGLLAPLVVLYVLKIRRQRLRVASTWLWASAARDLRARHPLRRLFWQIPLVLQAIALVALAVTLGRPATRGGTIVGDHVAIVVDTSASMTARMDTGGLRIEAARDAAHEVIDALSPGAEAIIVDAGPSPRVVAPLDRDRSRLHAAVDRVQAGEATGALQRAVALASDRLRQLQGRKRLVVVTDGALADPHALAHIALPLDVVRVGTPVENTAIVRIDVRRGQDPVTRRDQVQAFALISNFGASERDLFVTLRPRNVAQPLTSRRVHLAPGERTPVVLTFEPAPGDAGMGLVVELSPRDAMPADDCAYGRVPVGRQLPVVVAPKNANPWFVRALQADPSAEVLGAALADLASADVPEDALVLIDGACPQHIPGGDFVLLNPPPGPCKTVVVGKTTKGPTITSWNETDARLRFLTLDGVRVAAARILELQSPGDSLIRAREGTVVADVSPPGRVGTLVAFDVGESNWPLKASFVLFVRNLLEVTRERRAHGVAGAARTGHPLQVHVPADVDEVAVQLPDETVRSAPARSGIAIVAGATQAGFYHVSWQGAHPGSVLVATNLTDAAESDLRPRKMAIDEAAVSVDSAKKVEAFNEWGWAVALVALVLLALDVWWLTRRPRPLPPSLARRPRLPDRTGAPAS